MLEYRTVQHSTAWYSAAQRDTIQRDTTQHSTAQYSAVYYSTAQYVTAQYCRPSPNAGVRSKQSHQLQETNSFVRVLVIHARKTKYSRY